LTVKDTQKTVPGGIRDAAVRTITPGCSGFETISSCFQKDNLLPFCPFIKAQCNDFEKNATNMRRQVEICEKCNYSKP